MSYSQAQIDALRKAIATGAKRVVYEAGGEKRDTTYHSFDEMRRALAMMEQEAGQVLRPRTTFVEHHRD